MSALSVRYYNKGAISVHFLYFYLYNYLCTLKG